MARQGRVKKGGSSSSSSDSGSERPPRRERLEKASREEAQQSVVGDVQASPVRSEGENSLQEEGYLDNLSQMQAEAF
eukprot:1041651-Prorocentrum_minimum.AAC.1